MFLEYFNLQDKITVMIEKSTLNFLKSLKKNNNREWFEKNRAAYEDAKQNVVSMAEFLLQDMAKTDARFAEIKPSSCLFRINRDVRFSKDKSPYKTNFGAAFSVGGKKGPQAGFYVHIDPTAAFAGGGIWQPEPAVLQKIRQEIDYQFADFKAVIYQKKFKAMFGDMSQEDALKKVPKGYDAENPAADFLRCKNFVFSRSFTETELMSTSFYTELKSSYHTILPFLTFLNSAIEE